MQVYFSCFNEILHFRDYRKYFYAARLVWLCGKFQERNSVQIRPLQNAKQFKKNLLFSQPEIAFEADKQVNINL